MFPKESDGCIFVKEVQDPSLYGVVKTNNNGVIMEFVEKPKNSISNLAIVGIYYFKEGSLLAKEIKHIIDNNIKIHGEYQITTVLENLKNKNLVFTPHRIDNWYDFGTPKNLLQSHAEILKKDNHEIKKFKNTIIIPPCYIAKDAIILNSKIGPHVSVGSGTTIKSSTMKNTIIQHNSYIDGANFNLSIIGSNVEYNQKFKNVNIGDYSTFK